MRTLKRFNTEIEVYSIDEAFIDLSNFSDSEIEKVGEKSEKQFCNGLVLTSIGIAKTKTLEIKLQIILQRKNNQVLPV